MTEIARAGLTGARRLVGQWRYSTLLVTLSLALCLGPLFPGVALIGLLQQFLFITLALGAAEASRASQPVRRLMAILVIANVSFFLLLSAFASLESLRFLTVLSAVALGLAVLYVTAQALLTERGRGADALAGAAFGYLMLGVVWGMVYTQIELVAPGAFNLIDDGSAASDQLVYFSLVTLTTLGYGDVTPAIPLTRLFAAVQAAQGALYLALFIGRVLVLAHLSAED